MKIQGRRSCSILMPLSAIRKKPSVRKQRSPSNASNKNREYVHASTRSLVEESLGSRFSASIAKYSLSSVALVLPGYVRILGGSTSSSC